ncbi:MAG: hypothetical protein EP146_16765 [Oscillibacter sp.]|uniref:permease prefix domain 1-containing protein n=1 Tax=Oscillibacter sp. TaxID=1945593 RepID=UPI0013287DF5|nr:permease prefix domain 1-containing protein [Oscillibacter sp.]MUU12877.1 hypothetical protein [Oscillibacter sp.]
MDRRDYTDRVLSSLRRVTEKEREAIRSELDGHIEDHMEALRELGYDEELAEERAIAAMGEPDEVGRELNRQYTGWGWVLVSRAAVVLTVVLCAQALLALGILGWLLIASPPVFIRMNRLHIPLWQQRSGWISAFQLETTSCGFTGSA